MSTRAIELERVTKIYPGGVRALDAVSLEVEEGEHCCLLGPNGAGKMTIISATSAALIVLLAGEPRAANIFSGLILGPIVPLEGVILISVHDESGITISAVALMGLACLAWVWSSRLLSFERLVGA